MSFESIERMTREKLAGALADGGFDPAAGIAGLTVNRWAHGYAYWHNPLSGDVYEEEDAPNVIGRRSLGRTPSLFPYSTPSTRATSCHETNLKFCLSSGAMFRPS